MDAASAGHGSYSGQSTTSCCMADETNSHVMSGEGTNINRSTIGTEPQVMQNHVPSLGTNGEGVLGNSVFEPHLNSSTAVTNQNTNILRRSTPTVEILFPRLQHIKERHRKEYTCPKQLPIYVEGSLDQLASGHACGHREFTNSFVETSNHYSVLAVGPGSWLDDDPTAKVQPEELVNMATAATVKSGRPADQVFSSPKLPHERSSVETFNTVDYLAIGLSLPNQKG